MKKRKDLDSLPVEKKPKIFQETKIAKFCISSNTEFEIIEKKEITGEPLQDFLNTLKIKTNPIYTKKNNEEHTPLTYAAINKNFSVFNLLIENKANVDFQNTQGNSILHNIIEQRGNFSEYIEKLIISGADIEIMNNKGQTPLEFAYELKNIPALLSLIGRGAKITPNVEKDTYQKEPLDKWHKACQELVHLATKAWTLSTIGKTEPICHSEEKLSRFNEIEKANQGSINLIVLNIAVSSTPQFAHEIQENLLLLFKTYQLTPEIPSKLSPNIFEKFGVTENINYIGEPEDSDGYIEF